MARLEFPTAQQMSKEQTVVCAEATAGPRGKVPAPMIAWIRNPELARRGQKVGELLRFDTSLGPRLTEIAILICARHWTSHHEWTAHKVLALQANVAPELIASIAARRVPAFEDEITRIVYEVASELLSSGRLNAALYEKGMQLLGEQRLVELVSVLGYYCWVALTLNAFELGQPTSFAGELEISQSN